MFSKVPSFAFSGFWTLTLKMTQHFKLIYNIGKSDWNILLNIMKTAQDSYSITIKQIVRFQERMHLEKFQIDEIQNGRLLAIIHLRPEQNKTKCAISGEDVSWKISTRSNSKWPPYRPSFIFTWLIFGKPC